MTKVLRLIVALGVGGLFVLPAVAAAAGNVTLHPSGFGEKSYAAWKAHEGQVDSRGNDNQSLYFQKNTATSTVAAGVALFKGFSGLTLGQITGLEWEHRNDGHCGAGAPRWTFISRDAGGQRFVTHLGCFAAAHTAGGTSTDRSGMTQTWTRDTYNNGTVGQPCVRFDPEPVEVFADCDDFEITAFGIVFDEGSDAGRCAGVAGTLTGRSCVHLDNIKVEAAGTLYCWTSANDNGNGAACAPVEASALSLSTAALSPLSGIVGDANDPEVVAATSAMYPSVPFATWLFYPYVY